MKKRIIRLILSSLSVVSSTLYTTTYANERNKQKNTSLAYKENLTKNKKAKDTHPKNRLRSKSVRNLKTPLVLAGIIAGSAISTYLSIKCIETLVRRHSVRNLHNSIKKRYNADTAEFMQEKAGDHWCWLSCIQALYKFWGFDIPAEELYKKLTNRSPEFFIVDRLSGSGLEEEFDMNFSSVTTQLKPIFGLIEVKRSEGIKKIQENIEKFYNYIGKVPFYIRDSDVAAMNGGHAVVIKQILKNSFTIEEPDTQLQYKRDSFDYCLNYFQEPRVISNDHMSINLIALVKSDNPIKSVYVPADNPTGELIKFGDGWAVKYDESVMHHFQAT